MTGQLNTIVTLQRTLNQLGDLEERLHGIPDWMQELHEEHSQQQAEIDALGERAEEARHQRKAAEAALEDAQEKLKHYQSQIGRVSTQREYGALLKEIDTVKGQIASFEKEALESLETFENAESEKQELEGAFQELDQRYQTELAKWEQEKPGVERDLTTLRGEITRLREDVSQPNLVIFDRLYERSGGQALAPVLRVDGLKKGPRTWCCGFCNYRIRPQVVVEIRNQGSVLLCDCGQRILFVEDQPSPESDDGG